MGELDQVIFSGLTHLPAVELSERLIRLLPENQQKLFFSDNGSTAVEVAVKMALQYHFNRGNQKTVLLAFEEGFHGDTFGAMSVSGLSVYNGPFEGLTLKVRRIPVPASKDVDDILNLIDTLTEDQTVAAFVYEPLIQGAAAMKTHSAAGLDKILEHLRSKNVLLIADEVMTGFGKTGRHFASSGLNTLPDFICLSKALTAGLLPMAITSCTMEVYNAFYSDDISKGFFHGHTYTANPLSCTAALAALDLLESKPIQEGIARISKSHQAFSQKIKDHPLIKEIRHCGVILAMELNVETHRYGNFRDRVFKFFMDRGIYLRPLGSTVYLLPPYIIQEEELTRLYVGFEALLHHLSTQEF
jgi:adenosylmethionine-8-amino-7-oxononanoate aminotransferase